jgi:hypothetical protein
MRPQTTETTTTAYSGVEYFRFNTAWLSRLAAPRSTSLQQRGPAEDHLNDDMHQVTGKENRQQHSRGVPLFANEVTSIGVLDPIYIHIDFDSRRGVRPKDMVFPRRSGLQVLPPMLKWEELLL